MWFWNWKILNSQPSHLWIDLELCLFWWECDLKRKKKDGDGKRENYDHLHHFCVALLQFSRTYTFLHPHSYAEAHTLLLFVCRLLSAVIGVTFIFAPEACLPVSITWSQTWRDGDLTECHMIGMNAEPNVPERAILYRSPAARRMIGSPAVSVLVTTARYTTRAQTANWAQRCI